MPKSNTLFVLLFFVVAFASVFVAAQPLAEGEWTKKKERPWRAALPDPGRHRSERALDPAPALREVRKGVGRCYDSLTPTNRHDSD